MVMVQLVAQSNCGQIVMVDSQDWCFERPMCRRIAVVTADGQSGFWPNCPALQLSSHHKDSTLSFQRRGRPDRIARCHSLAKFAFANAVECIGSYSQVV